MTGHRIELMTEHYTHLLEEDYAAIERCRTMCSGDAGLMIRITPSKNNYTKSIEVKEKETGYPPVSFDDNTDRGTYRNGRNRRRHHPVDLRGDK